jgi:hypothetical protein
MRALSMGVLAVMCEISPGIVADLGFIKNLIPTPHLNKLLLTQSQVEEVGEEV